MDVNNSSSTSDFCILSVEIREIDVIAVVEMSDGCNSTAGLGSGPGYELVGSNGA